MQGSAAEFSRLALRAVCQRPPSEWVKLFKKEEKEADHGFGATGKKGEKEMWEMMSYRVIYLICRRKFWTPFLG